MNTSLSFLGLRVCVLTVCFLASGGCTGDRGPTDGTAVIDGVQTLGAAGRGDGGLHEPRGIEALPDASCLVIDRTGRIQHFDRDGSVERVWWLAEWANGQPIDLTCTPWNTVLIPDTHYARILEYDLAGQEVRRFGADLKMGLVRGVTVGHDETIYVADYANDDRVHRFRRDGEYIGSFGVSGEGPGEFIRPEGLATGASGDIYVVDCGNHRVQRFSPDGQFVATFGQPGEDPGSFLFPFDIAPGSDDTLYVVDYRGNRVQRFRADGTFLGAAGTAGREPGEFATPRGVAVLPSARGDRIYVADTNNHRVQTFVWRYDNSGQRR
ncbi:MAG: 6-bladed beta-propeller [Planctomycetota bacterium]